MKISKTCLIALTCGALAFSCGAVQIYIPNASFETPVFPDGSSLTYVTPGLVYGWNWTGPNTQFGIFNPNDVQFMGGSGDTTPLPSPADGYQYAALGGPAQSVSSIENPAALATILPFTRYTLDIAAINPSAQNIGGGLGTLQLSLLAGANTVASSSINYSTFANGQIRLLETTFTTGGNTDTRVGQDLNVKVTFTADHFLGSNGFFDNLVLNATPVPEPASLPLFLLASIAGFYRVRLYRPKPV